MAEARYPESIRAEAVSATARVTPGPGESWVVLVYAGAPVVLTDPRGGVYRRVPLLGPRPLRLEAGVLRVAAQGGELRVRVSDWLEEANLRRLLDELPPPSPADGARLRLLRELLRPHDELVLTLERRARSAAALTPGAAMPLDLQRIERELGEATADELARLAELLRTRWRVAVSPDGVPAEGLYTLSLRPYAGQTKIEAIKVLRELTELGLAEAKRLVEAGGVALRNQDPARAEQAKQALAAAGAEVDLLAEG